MRIVISPISTKKWRAYFNDGSHTDFGSKGMDDFTITHDIAQRERYRKRHRKDLETKDPKRAGYLAYYLLWNLPTLSQSLVDYKARFGDN